MKSSKKIIIINVILLLIIASIVIISINRNKHQTEENITISFNANGGKRIISKTIAKGEKITLPPTEKEGYNFGGWY